jgi:hypothetical protein
MCLANEVAPHVKRSDTERCTTRQNGSPAYGERGVRSAGRLFCSRLEMASAKKALGKGRCSVSGVTFGVWSSGSWVRSESPTADASWS